MSAKPSIRKLISKKIWETSLKFFLVISAVFSVFSFITYYTFDFYRTDGTIKSIKGTIDESLILGDSFQLTRQVSSLVNSGLFYSISIFDKNHDLVVSKGEISLSPIDEEYSFMLSHLKLLVLKRYPIEGFSEQKGVMITASEVSLKAFFLIFLVVMGCSFLFTRILSGRIEKISQVIADPIEKFNHKVSSHGSSNHEIVSPYGEISNLDREFDNLMARIKQAEIASKELEISKAIVRTTQMLAHDIRKPFALLTALTDMIQGSKDQKNINKIIGKNLPTIKSAINSVNGMLQDIMDVDGADLNLELNPQSLRQMMGDCLQKVFCFTYGHSIVIHTDGMKAGKVNIHQIKIERVLTNIFTNAMEQMGREGEIWISTHEIDEMVQVGIRNSGSFIHEDERDKIFKSFYTKGKSWGTGLGLAISKKIIEAHGGKIWVESSKSRGTEFFFTIPAAHVPEDQSIMILKYSEDYSQVNESFEHEDEPYEELGLVSIAIIDDEPIYRHHFLTQLKVSGLLSKVKLQEYPNAELALKEIKEGKSFDMVILDLDLGTNIHGIKALPQLRESLGSEAEIYLHSSRVSPSNEIGLESQEASGFIMKPISEDMLQSIVRSCLGLYIPKSTFNGRVLIIDDDPISGFIDVESLQKRGCLVSQFPHVDAAIDALELGDIQTSDVSCIISDKYIGAVDVEEIDLPEMLRKMGYHKPIYVASNLYDDVEHKPSPGFKYGIPKGRLQKILMDGLSV